ncbi:glycine cleavage system aminomethyltransferase GcvT [Salisediminibacterium halotolerans]|uniref:glycine cleavage system aminomethyltransferase GcvT n=1 Tax=Salisediminibacterium halotolerans TaxID=517425 RepID=UPI000B88DCAF|nr:glycine cleavage system aminomethyltransferase GcvT [Salisediminibacterium haloalkalitolerans]
MVLALKRTPLFTEYKKSGAKTVDFGGWELPVSFGGIKQEHAAVRERAGIFDVSHMGEVIVYGPGTIEFLQYIMTNDTAKSKDGKCQYTAMCYEHGGTVDDLVWYRLNEEKALLIVNAANEEKDVDWLSEQSRSFSGVKVENVSQNYAQLAFQGPKAETVLQRLTEESLAAITFFSFKESVTIAGTDVLISRTGYTGEDGFELYLAPENAPALWEAILAEGEAEGVEPCGLGARDTLRFEANLALYGQELTEEITPVEAGLGFAVKTNVDAPFIGKEVLKRQKAEGPPRKLAGIEMIDKGIPRNGYNVLAEGRLIGQITSGTHSPTLQKNLGLALLEPEYCEPGNKLQVDIRNRQLEAVVIERPFYKRGN